MSNEITCVIVGGGGHAGVLIDALAESASSHRLAVVDRDTSLWGSLLMDVPIVGGDEMMTALVANGVTHFAIGLGSIGDTGPRKRLFEAACAAGLTPLTIIHPRAIVSRWARVDAGAQVLAGAIVNANAMLGVNTIVNSAAVVEHDCRVGSHAHVATGARLASGVRIGNGAHIGAGATVRQLLSIGAHSIVGAGAVVVKDVDAHAIVVGIPAAPLERHTTMPA